MRFCHPCTPTSDSRDGKQAAPFHRRIDLTPTVQRDQPHLIVFSPHAIFPGQIARPTPCPKDLTEFPFAHNFSKPGLEVL
jgi:hypothetical protein